MCSHAIRLLALTVSAIALGAVVTTGAAEGSSRHIRKHYQPMSYQQRTGVRFNDAWAPGEVRPAAAPPRRTGSACPGNARAIDCTVWPPPFDDDPDRKATSSDGGG
jgi:hypothetical protein